jgi:hypothetical protein
VGTEAGPQTCEIALADGRRLSRTLRQDEVFRVKSPA